VKKGDCLRIKIWNFDSAVSRTIQSNFSHWNITVNSKCCLQILKDSIRDRRELFENKREVGNLVRLFL
jgi:hypothetical protein